MGRSHRSRDKSLKKILMHDLTPIIIKFGYPPMLLAIDETSSILSLESLGIKDGEQILTSERQDNSVSAFTFPSDQPASVALDSKAPENNAKTTPSNERNNSGNRFAPTTAPVSGGFGSRPVVQASDVLPSFQARTTSGNTFGGLPAVDFSFKPAPMRSTPPPPPPVAPSRSVDAVRLRDQGFLVVREVDDDNSCLFNSIAYILDPGMKNNIQGLRQIVAQAVEANPDAYSDAVLGRPRSEYCDWIKKKDSWGGAIELAVFSEHYKTEIDSIDVSTNRVDRFGENQYSQRAMVMYSGIHYDALALTPGLDIPSDCDQTLFEASSEDFIDAGVQLAARLKKVCESMPCI
ncbi:hypothetical protein BGZ76_010393 [Entomortierella beljakovae]|nr:hypothetical protein BGZ76_010393 [Entomortierella beljakovae]